MSAFWPVDNDRAIDQVRKLQERKRNEDIQLDIDNLIEAQKEVIKIAEEAIFKLNELKQFIK